MEEVLFVNVLYYMVTEGTCTFAKPLGTSTSHPRGSSLRGDSTGKFLFLTALTQSPPKTAYE